MVCWVVCWHMARPLRIEYEGAVYHITSRGNAFQDIFLDDEDRLNFLKVLEDVVASTTGSATPAV